MNREMVSELPADYKQATARILGLRAKAISTKSLLRYPGGKSRAVATLRKYLPEHLEAICSPFFGGGSFELACAADGIAVSGYDAFQPVVDFWQEAIKQPTLLSEQVREYYPLSKTKFYDLQKSYHNINTPLERAAVFYVLNRSSFSGTTLSGGMSPGHPRFTESAIERLREFTVSNLSVEFADYRKSLERHSDTFLYLDPPYANGGKLYGDRGDMHEGFNHAELASILNKRDGWVLSYNDCQEVRDLYAGQRIVAPEWTYGMNGNKVSNELLIVNA